MTNLLEQHAKSFYWASFFLPKSMFNKCSSLYNFCRTVDNIADQDIALERKKEQLKYFRKKFQEKNQQDTVIKNMWDIMEEFNISQIIVNDLFDGVESDLKKEVRIKTKKELLVYCYRVAGTVGLMMAKIFNVKKKESLRGAIDLGIAMQLTNIARDVMEDEKKNRVYLFGYTKDTFINIKKTIYEANIFYNNSFSALRDIPLKYRFSIIVARRVYRQIGKKIFDVKDIENYKKAGKIYVSNFSKLIQTFFSLIDLILLFFIGEKKDEQEFHYNLISEDISLNERF